jgi:hypothetical protein
MIIMFGTWHSCSLHILDKTTPFFSANLDT